MNWKLVLAILTCNILFMSSSYTMLIPFLPMYLTMELGVSEADVNIWSGIVFSASFLVSAIMAPIWGRMADTKGKRIMAMRASFLLSISYFLGGIVETPGQLTLMRLFQGFASGLWPMDLAIMTLYAPPKKLGFCLGVMQGTLTAGGVVGPLLGGVLAEAVGMRYSFFLAAAALFMNFLIFTFIIKEPPTAKKAADQEAAPEEDVSPWRMPLLRNMLLCGTLVQMVILILQPVLTTYVAKLAGPMPNIVFVAGLVFSLGGIAGAMAAPFWGTFGQRRGFFRAMCLGMAGAGLSMIIQGIPDPPAVRRHAVRRRPLLLRHPSVHQRRARQQHPAVLQGAHLRHAVCRTAGRLHGWPPARRPHCDIPRHPLCLRLLRPPAALPELCHLAPLPRPARLLSAHDLLRFCRSSRTLRRPRRNNM